MNKGKILTCVVTGALIVEAPPTVQTLRSLLLLEPALEAAIQSEGQPVPNKPAEPGMPGTGRAVDVALMTTAHSGTVQVMQNTIFRAEYRLPQAFDVRPIAGGFFVSPGSAQSSTEESS